MLMSVLAAAISLELRLVSLEVVAPVVLVELLVAPIVLLLLCLSLLRVVSLDATEDLLLSSDVEGCVRLVEAVPAIDPVPLVLCSRLELDAELLGVLLAE